MSQMVPASTEDGVPVEVHYRMVPKLGGLRTQYIVELENDEDGWIVAKCSELNVVTQGKTLEEIEKNVIEAIELALEATSNNNEFTLRILKKLSD